MKKEIPKTKKEKKTVAANTASLPATSPQRPLKLFIKNILLLAGSIILLLMMKSYNNGYKWTYETLLRDNLIFMNEAKKMTDEEKMEYKLGFSWKYMNFIKENTPEDAIILMPPDTVFL
jgi:hypothetical protein